MRKSNFCSRSKLIEVFVPLEMVLYLDFLRLTPHNSISSDAKRPACSTCLRSHAYAASHANAETVLPLEPECTYGKSIVLSRKPGSPL